ncbi:MAG TPA: hypothetical protein VGE63_02870 [Candidatus Paceibacterota bacterium]
MNHRTLKALTLPELLISLSVIIILATVLLPSLAGARQRAAKAAAIKTVSALRQKSEVLLTPTTVGGSTNAKVYRNDLCSVGFVEDAQSVTKRLSYAAYNPASDSFVKEVASNTDIGKDNAVTCHEKSDGTAWFVIADIETKSPNVTMYCTDYTGFAGEISPTNLVDDWQCDPDNSTVVYELGSGFSQDGGQVCTPGQANCNICIDNPTTQWDDCDTDCDDDGIPNEQDPCDACDKDGSVGDVCGPSNHFAPFNYIVRTADVQQDGKYVVGGSFNMYDTTTVWKLARINQKGELDTTFQTTGALNGLKGANENGSSNPDTDAEPFFTQGGGAGTAGVNVLSTGKILVLGSGFDDSAETTYNDLRVDGKGLIMLNSNGTLDSAFMTKLDDGLMCGLGAPYCGTASSIESAGKIWVSGRFKKWDDNTKSSGQDVLSGIVILNSDGTMASNQISSDQLVWGGGGWVAPLMKASDGKIYAATGASSTSGDFDIKNITPGESVMARLNSDGTVDTSFRVSRSQFNNFAWIQSIIEIDGKIYISGQFTSSNNNYKNIMRLNSNGTTDATFNSGSLKIEAGYGAYMIKLSSGKILVFGDVNKYNTTSVNNIIRITAAGALDTTFNAGNGIVELNKYRPSKYGTSPSGALGTRIVRSVSENSDGSLFVVGEFSNWDGQQQGYTVMLKADGTKMPH